MFDIKIETGKQCDNSSSSWSSGGMGIAREKIVAIPESLLEHGRRSINASEKVASPASREDMGFLGKPIFVPI